MRFLRSLRLPYLGMGPILVAVVLTAAVLSAIWPALHGVEVYPDPVASDNAWNNFYKAKDYRVVELAIVLIAGLSITIAVVCEWIASGRADMRRSLNELLLVSLIPAAWRLALACSIPSDRLPPLRFLAAFPLAAAVSICALARYRKQLIPQQVLSIGGGILVTLLIAIYAGLAFPVSISRLIPRTVPHWHSLPSDFAVGGAIVAACALIAMWIASKSADVFEQRVHAILRLAQYPLPLLFFYMVPPQIVDPLNRFANPYPHALVITLTVCCIVSWLFMWRRFEKPGDAYPLARAIAPVAVAAIVLFIYCGSADLPRAFRDYFHWGEQSVPWQQWWDYGRRPYIDYVPIHGLMPFSRGFFSEVFFDGSAASYTASDVLLTGLAAVALALATSMLVTPLGALFLLLGTLPYLDRMYFLTPALFLMASPGLLRKPIGHLCLWMVTCLLMVAYNPTIGPAFVAGTVPLGLWLVYRTAKTNMMVLAAIVLVVAIIGIACWETPPMRSLEIQFTHFIVDNAWTNEVGNGIAWERGINMRESGSALDSTQFIWEIARIAWAPVALFAAVLFWKEFQREPAARRPSLLVLAGCAPLVMLMTIPWIFGRIDPASSSRSGSLARLAVESVLPALVMLYFSREKLIGALLGTALVVGFCYPSNPASFDLDVSIAQSVQTRNVPADVEMVDGKDPKIGIPRLGQVLKPDPNFIEDIVGLKKILTEFLKPGESYLDLTNQTALYYYLDLPSPVRYAAYVATNSRLQEGELQQLKEHPVHTVMIGPAGWLDDAPASLRAYELYRQYALRFCPVQRGQWIFLVDPARFPSLPPVGSEAQLQVLDSVFRKQNLLRLPVSWGQSWKYMQNRFDHVASIDTKQTSFTHDVQLQPDGSFTPTGPAPYWEYRIPLAVKNGQTADFVRLRFDEASTDPAALRFALKNICNPLPAGAEPAMTCSWVLDGGGYSSPVQFKAMRGNLVIPLGAYPRWLLGKSPTTFRLDFQNPKFAKWFRVSEIEFLHLRSL